MLRGVPTLAVVVLAVVLVVVVGMLIEEEATWLLSGARLAAVASLAEESEPINQSH